MFELKKENQSRISSQFRPGLKNAAMRRCAFTLIELMIVISIIAIALSFLVPALAPATARSLKVPRANSPPISRMRARLQSRSGPRRDVLIPDTNANRARSAIS